METLLEKFLGTLIGGALGDAIGKSLEDVPAKEAVEFYGCKVKSFVEPHPLSPCVGLEPNQITDETKITLLLVESLIERKSLDPYHFFAKLRDWAKKEQEHRYPDPTLLTAIDLLSSGVSLEEAGLVSFSVEGVLRATATGLLHYYSPPLAAEAGRLVSLITHRSKEIYDASAVVSALVAFLLLESFDLTDPLERFALIEHLKTLMKYEKNRAYIEKVKRLLQESAQVQRGVEELGNSTFVFEALPLSVFLFLHHWENPIEAFWEGVNACGAVGGDTDAIGYLVGSFVGAYRGVGVFPAELLENLENYPYYISLAEKLYNITLDLMRRN
ncbi:MAG: ADP-ribosylglycohydrolase family protein [Aquificaceae bacterium]|nr:ADP-ribosylglycohydrolase family protein [Aquificaceae bacterium]MCX8060370.1 ADP-ribosylglycohydrolase family protein [Aquificaceae bacterium]MDW8096796.1 ADP-ribosylglycohydrolase family protein [Aquificaceae bacterium]